MNLPAKNLRTLLFVTLAAGAPACAADMDTQSPNGGGKADGLADQVAHSGSFVTYMAPGSDGCKIDIELDETELLEVVASDEGMHFEFEADGTDAKCDLNDEGSFDCDMSSPASDFLPISMSMTATWSNEDRFVAEFTMAIECEGEACQGIAEFMNMDAEDLPCKSTMLITGVRAQAEDFELTQGDYAIGLKEAGPATTCAFDVIGGLPDTVSLTADSPRGFAIDDGFEAFECDLEEGAGFSCAREVELQGMLFSSAVVGAWTSTDKAQGVLEVTVNCLAEDRAECAEMEEFTGKLPCRAYHDIALEAATAEDRS